MRELCLTANSIIDMCEVYMETSVRYGAVINNCAASKAYTVHHCSLRIVKQWYIKHTLRVLTLHYSQW